MIAELFKGHDLSTNRDHIAEDLHFVRPAFDRCSTRAGRLKSDEEDGVFGIRQAQRQVMQNPAACRHTARRNNDRWVVHLVDFLGLLGCRREYESGPLQGRAMSQLPYYLDGARWGYRLGNQELVDGMYRDGFFCPLAKMVMGETAEVLGEQYKITRDEQDQFALTSQQRAASAVAAGRFDAEIVPVTIESKKGSQVFSKDEHLFPDANLEKLAKLAPVFSKTGTITAGNSSGITDGAAAMVLAGEAFVKKNSLKPMARVLAVTSAGVDPRIMGIGPVPAMQKMEARFGLKLSDFDLVEVNEAFAAQVLACDRELHFDHAKLNVNGGAIAIGHPIGCTGTRITVTLLHEMLKRKSKRGVATLCVSGGMGMALAIETQ